MSRSAAWFLVLLLVAGCAADGAPSASTGAAAGATAPLVLAATVSVADAAAMRDDGAFILDVREPDEWTAGHIPGASLIPLGQLTARVGELPRGQRIVVVCRSGNRSAQGRDILLRAGFAAVTSLEGGMIDWSAAGLPHRDGRLRACPTSVTGAGRRRPSAADEASHGRIALPCMRRNFSRPLPAA